MALLGIPPWLMPTDVVGAMSAGGRLGLGRAQLGEQAREADQRNALGYATLGSHEATAGAQLHDKQAQDALNLQLHLSAAEEQRRRDEATQRARSEALAEQTRKNTAVETETKRAHTAAEDLKKTQLDELLKRQTQKEDAAMKLAKFKSLSSQLDHAKRAKMVADANLDADASSRAQQEIDALSQQLQEFSSPSGSSLGEPSDSGETFDEQLMNTLVLPSIFPEAGQSGAGLTPKTTESPLQYTIKRK